MIRLHAFPRIHASLIDLGSATPRVFGGAGFAVDGFPTILSAETSSSLSIDANDLLGERDLADFNSCVERFIDKTGISGFSVMLEGLPSQHVGFGSKTALLLGTLKALDELHHTRLTVAELQSLSGRGGTSGVGLHTFFRGGFVVDCGRIRTSQTQLLPSSAQHPVDLPILVAQHAFPSNWRVSLVLPSRSRHFGQAERAFFVKNTPIPVEEVLKCLGYVYHSLFPGVIARDIELFRAGLVGLHSVGFKRRELLNQDAATQDLIRLLMEIDRGAVGLSSMGPLVYVVAEEDNVKAHTQIAEICESHGAEILGLLKPRNEGFSLTEL